MPRTELTNHIRRLRFDRGEMTQEELARRAGCTRQTIIAIEQRRYAPSLELAFRIARAFGKGLEEVFQYDDDPRTTNNEQRTTAEGEGEYEFEGERRAGAPVDTRRPLR
jgi:putative transcriptional regulator